MSYKLSVLKFGSSVLLDEASIANVVAEIRRTVERGYHVIAVVSALGNSTDDLIARAHRFSENPEPTGLATLLATGEATSAALLEITLNETGVPAFVLDPAQVQLRTDGPALDSQLTSIDADLVRRKLEQRPVAVLPGFYGRNNDGATCLLGRGGSDLTALFLAHALSADQCRLVKDVDGLYNRDPNAPGPAPAQRYTALSWQDAHALSSQIVQPKAVHFAEERGLSFEVTSLGSNNPTVVGKGPTVAIATSDEPAQTA